MLLIECIVLFEARPARDKNIAANEICTVNNYLLEEVLVSAFMKPLQGEAKKHVCKGIKLEPVFIKQLAAMINLNADAKLHEESEGAFMSIHDCGLLQQYARGTDGTNTYLKDLSDYLAVTAHILDDGSNDFQVMRIKIKSRVTPNTFCNARSQVIANLGLAAFNTDNVVFAFVDAEDEDEDEIQHWVPQFHECIQLLHHNGTLVADNDRNLRYCAVIMFSDEIKDAYLLICKFIHGEVLAQF